MFGIIALVLIAIVALTLLSFALHLLFSPWLLLVAVGVLAWFKLRPRRSHRYWPAQRPRAARPLHAAGSQGVDPAVEASGRARQDAGITHGVGEQRAAFVGGHQVGGKIVSVAAAQRPELLFGPF